MSVSKTKSHVAHGVRGQVLYGEKANVINHARFILDFTRILSEKLFGHEREDVLLTGGAIEDQWESFLKDRRTEGEMRWWMRCMIERPEHLRDVADALFQLKNDGVKTAKGREVTLELISAYENCAGGFGSTTLPEIRREFIERYGKSRWPGDVSARRTLRALIPLGEAKRGRPVGAKSELKKYGWIKKQPRKLIQ
jgi:hypothetical protein